METSPLPLPPDLWSEGHRSTTHRLPGHPSLFLEIPPWAEGDVLTALSRSIHQEMQCAGGWAARPNTVVSTGKKEISSQAMSYIFARNAAGLFSTYAALYAAVRPKDITHLTPEALKESASRSYELGVHLERQSQQKLNLLFNDDLYERAQGKQHRQGVNHQR